MPSSMPTTIHLTGIVECLVPTWNGSLICNYKNTLCRCVPLTCIAESLVHEL